MRFELSELPFELNALEPLMSRKSLEFHHKIYQNNYLANLNNLIRGTKYKDLDLETIIKVTDGPLFNNASQVWNHTFFFECLRPGGTISIKESFAEILKYSFGSESFFKSAFVKAAESLFGAGWVWLVLNQKGTIEILQKCNAGNPLRIGLIPLMTCDLWEHAYYLDYQNNLCGYIDAFWKLLDWEMVERRYKTAMEKNNTLMDPV